MTIEYLEAQANELYAALVAARRARRDAHFAMCESFHARNRAHGSLEWAMDRSEYDDRDIQWRRDALAAAQQQLRRDERDFDQAHAAMEDAEKDFMEAVFEAEQERFERGFFGGAWFAPRWAA